MTLQAVADVQSRMQRRDARGQDVPSFRGRIVAVTDAAIDHRRNRRNMVGRLTGDEAGRDLHAAAVTGLAGRHGHLRVIESRRRPTGCARADTGGMTVFAQGRGGHVIALLADRFRAVVATRAVAGDAGVIEGRAQPVRGQMAIAALEIGGDVTRRLAGGLRTVVADDAESGHRQRNLRVIDRFGRIPAEHRVARVAGVAGGRVGRPLALGSRAVVASDAAAQHFSVIEMHVGAEREGVMAGRAIVGARNVRRGFRSRVECRALDMTKAAIARRALEDRIQMTGLTRQIAMNPIQFKAGRQMIERYRHRRRRSGGDRCTQQQDRRCSHEQRREQSNCAAQFHGLLHPRILPRGRRMAAVALLAVIAEMPVVLAMATRTYRRHLHGARGLQMARRALQFGVRTLQSKMRLLGMIEHPQLPAVRRMTGFTFAAETSFVKVFMRMALAAGRGRAVEGQRCMALGAAHDSMQTKQRKAGQVMIEHEAGAPILLAVALIAGFLQLAAMRILAAMTAGAILGQLLGGGDRSVAGIAIDLGVCADQRKVVPPSMVVTPQRPMLVVMTAVALCPKARGMRIVGFVATVTVLGNLVLVVAAGMAGEAIDALVHTEQFVAGFLQVIELGGLPFLGHMTLRAILAA
jgi:hypothetical protein